MTAPRPADPPGYVRGWVVLDHRKVSVYSVSLDEEKSLADVRACAMQYGGDPSSVSRTVFVADLPSSDESARVEP